MRFFLPVLARRSSLSKNRNTSKGDGPALTLASSVALGGPTEGGHGMPTKQRWRSGSTRLSIVRGPPSSAGCLRPKTRRTHRRLRPRGFFHALRSPSQGGRPRTMAVSSRAPVLTSRSPVSSVDDLDFLHPHRTKIPHANALVLHV
ncbi:hypothetical protein MPTK1_4g23550 [Marchantia polymorpha subsp. ruderalis]|uniref:Uncharacterized protein n=2 Tax=Marchantia polymorpha TaxID=3197 RepID=A0AAF6BD07_MARPO|nr:hypothetical protein MARPO_0020s0118 [Marchantia polymorpha]BBN09891.1 hypothetical protein Mp_4g23550 [Marchantia polymorpha subsp. ruderalis]|eukprot:PTQ44468.1 hypothetical protein MARPO_0020s0118 [Marchantia polymorpha]